MSLQSLALGELLESYVFELYMEQVSTDDNNVTTRLCVHKTLDSPILRRPLLLENSELNSCWRFVQAKVSRLDVHSNEFMDVGFISHLGGTKQHSII